MPEVLRSRQQRTPTTVTDEQFAHLYKAVNRRSELVDVLSLLEQSRGGQVVNSRAVDATVARLSATGVLTKRDFPRGRKPAAVAAV